jgi:hypothetical protein
MSSLQGMNASPSDRSCILKKDCIEGLSFAVWDIWSGGPKRCRRLWSFLIVDEVHNSVRPFLRCRLAPFHSFGFPSIQAFPLFNQLSFSLNSCLIFRHIFMLSNVLVPTRISYCSHERADWKRQGGSSRTIKARRVRDQNRCWGRTRSCTVCWASSLVPLAPSRLSDFLHIGVDWKGLGNHL